VLLVAIYCKTCTNDLKNTCTECNKPIDFSFVEVDEELDSRYFLFLLSLLDECLLIILQLN